MKINIHNLSREELENLILKEKEKNARLRKRCAKLKKDKEWWIDYFDKVYNEKLDALNTIEVFKKENAKLFSDAKFYKQMYKSATAIRESQQDLYESLKARYESLEARYELLHKLESTIQTDITQPIQPFNYN